MKTVYFKKKCPKMGVLKVFGVKNNVRICVVLIQKENVKEQIFMKNGVQEDINLFVRDNFFNAEAKKR